MTTSIFLVYCRRQVLDCSLNVDPAKYFNRLNCLPKGKKDAFFVAYPITWVYVHYLAEGG